MWSRPTRGCVGRRAPFERQRLPIATPVDGLWERADDETRRRGGGIGLYRVTRQCAALLAHDPRPGRGDLRIN